MKQLIPLSTLASDKSCKIEKILSSGSIRRRLLDLGFCEGTIIRCVQYSPAGDPIAYLVRGTVIALRKEDSSNILVREGDDRWD